MPSYAIRFDFPDLDAPAYAGMYQDGKRESFGLAPTLASAIQYEERETANRVAANAYPKAWQEYVTIIEVER